jgi:hypothetical protein
MKGNMYVKIAEQYLNDLLMKELNGDVMKTIKMILLVLVVQPQNFYPHLLMVQ